jgi:hypothetical protein
MKQVLILPAKRLFPPRDDEDLLSLYNNICAAPLAEHYKQSLIYYILMDRESDGLGDAEAPDGYATASGMPPDYRLMMRGLWYMDRLNFAVRAS